MQQSDDKLRLELEGKLAGAWVAELEECWRAHASALGERSLWVDLSGVLCVDTAGRYLLALMHAAGARFIAPGCAMAGLVREITGSWPVEARASGGGRRQPPQR